jgi:hypothetical protein
MTDTIVVPHRLQVLGQALQPVWRNLKDKLERSPVTSVPVHGIVDVISEHLGYLQGAVRSLASRIDDLMADVVSNEGVSDAEIFRAVGRFEAPLDDLAHHYQGVKALAAYGVDSEARDYLVAVHRHTLVQVRDWLKDLTDALEDPVSAARARGIPISGQVELPFTLTLTNAPELESLNAWISRQGFSRQRSSGLGFWGTVGALVLGWGIGDALFGDDD